MDQGSVREVFSGHVLEPEGPLSLYYQIKRQVKRSIEAGEIKPGALLPSERELCEVYGVSRPTVRQATQELIREGFLERRRGVGTYVAQPKIQQHLGSVLGFSERMEREGRSPGTRLLYRSVLPASGFGGDVENALQSAPDAAVLRLLRLRLADEEPVLLETVHLPLERFPGMEDEDLANGSLYRTLRERYGVEISYLRQTLEPVLLDQRETEMLQSQSGRPGMRAALTTYDQAGRPVEHTFSLVRGDRCQYYIEFNAGERNENGSAHLRQTQLEVSFPM